MDRPELEKLSPLFNEQSSKVVSFDEYAAKEKHLLQENLSLLEKAVLYFDNPHDFSNAFARVTRYVDPAHPGMASYAPAREIAETELSICGSGWNKQLQEKILKLRLEALRDCADYGSHVKSGELKPL